MSSVTVDKISVRVYPKTEGFASDLRRRMKEQEERARPLRVQVEPELKQFKLNEIQRRLDSLRARVGVDLDEATSREVDKRLDRLAAEREARVEVGVDRFEEARRKLQALANNNTKQMRVAVEGADRVLRDMDRIHADFERKLGDLRAEFKIDPKLDLTQARRTSEEFKRRLEELEHEHDIKVNVELEHVKRAKWELDRLTKERDVTINADVDELAARLKLRWLTRPRFAKIIPIVEKNAWENAAKAMTRLTGLRLGKDFAKEFWDFGKNIDKWTPRIAAMGGVVMSVAAMFSHATGATLTFVGQLAKLGGLSMVLPGMLAAAGIGATTLVLALRDAGKYVGDLKGRFTQLRATMSGGFWKAAEKPIRDTVETLLPRLQQRLGRTSEMMGANFAAIVSQLRNTLTPRLVDELFTNLDRSLVALQPGLMSFTHALTTMGVHGAKHLVTLNAWISRVGDSFSKWIEKAVSSGEFDRWVRDGAGAAKEFGRALGALGGVFKGVTRAASRAGHSGLSTMADGLERLNKAIRDPKGAAALTRFFTDARKAADNVYAGIGQVAAAIGSVSKPIGNAMQSATRGVRALLEGVGDIIRSPKFTGGLEAMFSGFERGFAPLKQHADSFATVLGNVMRLVGDFAQVAGPVVGAVIDGLAPLVKRLADRFHELLPSLKAFVETTLAPTLRAIGEAAAFAWPLIEKLGFALLALVGAFKAYKLTRAVQTLVSDIRGIGGASKVASGALGDAALGGVLGGFTGKAGKAAGAVGKLGGALRLLGRAAGGIGLAWSVLDLFSGPIESFDDWARGIKKINRPLDHYQDVLKGASSAQDVYNRSLRGVVDTTNSWDPRVAKAVNKEFGSLGQTLKTLGQSQGWYRGLSENFLGLGLDSTLAERGTFRKELLSMDSALRDLAVSGERVAGVRLQEFAREAVNAKVTFGEFAESMPQTAALLEQLGGKAGIAADGFMLQRLAAGDLKLQLDETGQAFLTVKGSVEDMSATSRSALDTWGEVFGDASEAPQTLVDAVQRAKGQTVMTLDEQTDYLRNHMDTFSRLMEDGGAGARQAFERMIAPLSSETQAKLIELWDAVQSVNTEKSAAAGTAMWQGVADAFAKGAAAAPDFDPAEKWDNAGLEQKVGDALLTIQDNMRLMGDAARAGGANASNQLGTGLTPMPMVATGITNLVPSAVTTGLAPMILGVGLSATNAVSQFRSGLGGMVGTASSIAGRVAGAVVGGLSGLASTVYQSGLAVARSFASGIESAIETAVGAARKLVQSVRDFFPGSPAKRGPFSGRGWVTYSGMAVGRAFADGMRRTTGEAVNYAERFASQVHTATTVTPGKVTQETLLKGGGPGAYTRTPIRLVIDDKTAFNAHVENIADTSALKLMEVIS